jgi:hypothetical protein
VTRTLSDSGRFAADQTQPARAVLELAWYDSDHPVRWRDMIALWRFEAELRELFCACLAAAPFPAFFWETPPVSRALAARPFTCVLVDAPMLATRAPEPGAFDAHIADGAGTDAVRSFDNLGGDAVLIAPCANAAPQHYAHLAAFLRGAPRTQAHALWRVVGRAVAARIREKPLWVSTSGAGVAWLHVRLDTRPKYYTHAPYRVVPSPGR